jgi:hypothetical protein
MPALQNLVLTDRTTPTAVSHTFTPRGHEGKDGGRVVEAGAVPLVDSHFTIEPWKTPSGRFRVRLRLSVPIAQTQTINGVSVTIAARVSRATVDFDFAPDSTQAERNNVVGMIADSLGTSKTLVNDALTKLENVW